MIKQSIWGELSKLILLPLLVAGFVIFLFPTGNNTNWVNNQATLVNTVNTATQFSATLSSQLGAYFIDRLGALETTSHNQHPSAFTKDQREVIPILSNQEITSCNRLFFAQNEEIIDPDGRLGKGINAGWAGGEGQFESIYDSSQANSKITYGIGWVGGAMVGDINGFADRGVLRPAMAVAQGINETTQWAEQALGLPPDSLTAAAFAFEPGLALPKLSEGIGAIKGYASSWARGGEVVEETSAIDNSIESIEKFFKGQGEIIRNSDEDTILMKGNKKIRFDINDPHGDSPHFHIEEKNLNGRWKDAGPEHRYYFKE